MDNDTVQYILVGAFFLLLIGWMIYKKVHQRRRRSNTRTDVCNSCCTGCSLSSRPREFKPKKSSGQRGDNNCCEKGENNCCG